MTTTKRDESLRANSPRSRHAERERADAADEVECFFSGRRVPRRDAVQVRLGPGQKVWMLREYCREG